VHTRTKNKIEKRQNIYIYILDKEKMC
jgi:hypothetical protein